MRLPSSTLLSNAAWTLAVASLVSGSIWTYRHLHSSPPAGGGGSPAQRPAAAVLVIPNAQLDLGLVSTSGHLQIPLDISNRSSDAVSVTEFLTSCGCAGVEPSTVLVGPGQSARVVLSLDLTKSWGPPLALGATEIPFEARVAARFTVNDEPDYQTWFVRGRAKPYFRTDPPRLTFGRRSVLQGDGEPLRFRLLTLVPTDGIYTQSTSEGWDVRIRPTGKVNEYSGECWATRPPPVGQHKVTVRLRLTGPGSALLDTDLVIDGDVLPDVQPYPHRLMFGGRMAGGMAEEHLLIESLSARSIRLTGVDSTSPALLAFAKLDGKGSRHDVRVLWRQDVGTHEARLTINYEDEDGRLGSIEVVAQGVGFGS
jgi:hypothetical protein